MVAKVFTIASGKGGTGKTTTTVNLGTSLALLGKKTLILDADIGMANMALIMGLEKSPVTLHDVLAREADVQDAIYKGPGGLMVIPSGMSLQGFQKADPEVLQEVMVAAMKDVDYMLIDAPAGISRDGVIPLAIADEVLLVVNPELSSMADALKTKTLVEVVGGHIGGVILNRIALEQTELTTNKISELLDTKVIGTVPEDSNVRRSAAFKTPIVMRTPDSPAAKAYKQLAASISGEQYVEEKEDAKKESFVDRLARTLFGGK